ncbi:MAG: ACP S-malonyltransferase [Nisaea sp.]|nr:ACP S-malonyltransferase [Nisaea sp.]
MNFNKTSSAMIFPGQGSQYVGMGVKLADSYTVAKAVFNEVDDALGQSLFRVMKEGPESELRLTSNTQPALMAVSLAVVRVLEQISNRSIEKMVSFLAGHSLGEYSALTAAGSFSLADSARLLRLRGESMQNAVPVGTGGMAALLGAELDLAKEIATLASSHGVCDIANDNAPGQIVLSGELETVKQAIEIAKTKGVRRAILLPVSAPFHCSLMKPAAEKMLESLSSIKINNPKVPIVTNISAHKIKGEPDEIRRSLVLQVTSMVRWQESIKWMANNGIKSMVEIGAGQVLSGLNKRIDKDLKSISIEDPDTIEEFLKNLR